LPLLAVSLVLATKFLRDFKKECQNNYMGDLADDSLFRSTEALTTDRHFEQEGFTWLLRPES
jgi:hypothetical protein